jgi:hypothetical protein
MHHHKTFHIDIADLNKVYIYVIHQYFVGKVMFEKIHEV